MGWPNKTQGGNNMENHEADDELLQLSATAGEELL
jgi:hypothetical protein